MRSDRVRSRVSDPWTQSGIGPGRIRTVHFCEGDVKDEKGMMRFVARSNPSHAPSEETRHKLLQDCGAILSPKGVPECFIGSLQVFSCVAFCNSGGPP